MLSSLERTGHTSISEILNLQMSKGFFQACNVSSERPDALKDLPKTLRGFVEKFPVKVEGKPIDLDQHRYLAPVYESMRFDQGDHFTSVLMTGAQVGKTIRELSGLMYAAAWFWGESFGYFLPDQNMSDIFSSQRWVPIMRSHPLFASLAGLLGRSGAEDRKRVRKFGESTIYFWYMGGKTSTEALPMRGVFFDEVRRMVFGDIQRAMERMSHCSYPIDEKISTAGYPDADIHYYFKRTNQNYFHTTCKCPEGIVLAERWPDCVGVRGKHDYFYRCPTCSMEITQPQDGRFIPRTPEVTEVGFHIPQILSPVMTCERLFHKYENAADRQEFFNSGLGLPWIDPTAIMVPLEVAMACVVPGLAWAQSGVNCLMGVDQRGGENHAVISDIDPETGKLRLRHLQIIQGEGKAVFAELYALMERFDVDTCVIDALPSYNEAVTFAKHYKRRVYLAYYSDNVNMARWSDRDEELKALQRAKPDSKFEFHVMLDRYKSLEWSLTKWVERRIACPEPRGLTQSLKVSGVTRQSHICLGDPDTHEQGLFYHLRSAAKRRIEIFTADTERRERVETGQFRMVFENIGIDPHFLHAMNYCSIAASRKVGGTELYTSDVRPPHMTPQEIKAENPAMSITQASDVSQLESRLPKLITAPGLPGTCGSCISFINGTYCEARSFNTKAALPACELYQEKSEP